jgi:3-carboxy-cis,cis-muconate cycloisomerase
MRPPSSPSEQRPAPYGGLLDQLSGAPAVDRELSDVAWLQAMLDTERALAWAQARAGLAPAAAAEAITAHCHAEAYDVAQLGRHALAAGNPVVPLVRELAARLPEHAAAYLHLGATSQDVIDTATCLVARRATEPLLTDLAATADSLADLADSHRTTLLPARTLLQQALPTTFGLTAAGWLVPVHETYLDLERVVRTRLAVQLGGAAGTLASLAGARDSSGDRYGAKDGARRRDGDGPRVLALLAAELGLAEPVLPWHTDRSRVAALAGALGAATGALGKVALDVALMAQTEVGEVSEGPGTDGAGRGGSSTLPHKRNPVGAVLVTAAARRAPGLVATLLATMPQEHQRAAGAWHAEWETLRELLHLTGGAAAHARTLAVGLRVVPGRMRENLDRTGGLLMAESVASRLAPALGTLAARDLVEHACVEAVRTDRPLRELLAGNAMVRQHLDPVDLDAALDPASYLGSADAFVDRALVHHRTSRPTPDGGAG